MGYTIATPIRDEATKIKLVSFFEKNWRDWPEVTGHKNANQYYRGPLPDGLPEHMSLSYDHGPCRIGFDFNAHDYERSYIFTACRWMALQAGKLYTFPTKIRPEFHGEYPVIVYDGDEATEPNLGEGPWPVIVEDRDFPEKIHWCLVDPWGCRTHLSKTEEKFNLGLFRFDGWALIRKEMQRLSALWSLCAETRFS